MNKKALACLVTVIMLLGGVVLFALNSKESSTPSQSQPNIETKNNPTFNKGQYITYDKSVLDADKGARILFFHAPWCPQCRQLDSEIKANSVPAGTTIYKVDYDSNQELRKKYGVTLQTTFIKIDSQGNLVKKYVSYEDPTFKSISQNIF